MKFAIKPTIARLAHRLGYEIRNISGIPRETLPAWMHSEAPRVEDETIPGAWGSNALEIVTHAYRPARLVHHRTRSGEDPRLKYIAFFLDLRGARTLELGPYEGQFSVLLEKLGVRANVALEVRPENLAKCARIQALHRLERTTFLRQNIEDLADGKEAPGYSGPFDLVFCIGLLYHLPAPAKALRWCRTQAPRLFLGTHYVEPAEARRYLPEVLHDAECREGDKVYRGKEYREGGLADPISGASPFSFWAYERDLIAMLHDAGYTRVEVLGKDLVNRMPHITILAE